MSLRRKAIFIERADCEISIEFIATGIAPDKFYKIKLRNGELYLTSAEFNCLYELFQDWWKPNDRP